MRFIFLCIFCVMTSNSAGAYFIKWELGEDIGVASLCRDQNAIMELARADQVDEAAALKTFASLTSRGLCIVFNEHRNFTVVKTLHKYQDFRGRNSFVLEVVSNRVLGFRGYVMAQGPVRPSI